MFREAVDAIHHKIIYPYLTSTEAQDDREFAHERALYLLEKQIDRNPILLSMMRRLFTYEDRLLPTMVFRRRFNNPLGVAAGFDKNARVFRSLGALGFGHIEVGSITTVSYRGHDRPRVFALPEDDALINRMGFPGDGVDACKRRLEDRLISPFFRSYKIGINIGASRPSFDKGTTIEDIRTAHQQLKGLGDYYVDNVSSPNTPGVRALQEPVVLDELLSATDEFHQTDKHGYFVGTPRLVKLAPDLSFEQIDKILDVVLRHNVHGIIVTNTTTDPKVKGKLIGKFGKEVGGVSGAPLTPRALEVSRYIFEHTEGRLPIVRAGGVMSSKDYWEAITLGGASLVQVYTAFVNHRTSTPNLAYYFNRDLTQSMKIAGVKNLEELRFSKLAYPNI